MTYIKFKYNAVSLAKLLLITLETVGSDKSV